MALKEVQYTVRISGVLIPIKECGFDITDGFLMFLNTDKHIIRVFAAGHWEQIIAEGEVA